GKTTTASMLTSVLREAGLSVVQNRAGANVPAGVASALLEEAGDVGVFEVDEAWLPLVASQLAPAVIVLGNLFRDRLDGYGELDAIASAWAAMASRGHATQLVLNADEPLTAMLHDRSSETGRRAPILFGVEDTTVATPEPEHANDAGRCRRCDGPLHFEARLLSHLGHYRCSACGGQRPTPDIRASTVHLAGMAGVSFSIEGSVETSVRLKVPGLHNVYNALAAVGAATALGVGASAISRALAAWTPAFGRGERIRLGATELTVLLMKNPAGANALMRMLADADMAPLTLLLALNDGPADGRDVSWIWDADFELLAPHVRTFDCAGQRADELALRLKYAGWPTSARTVERSIAAALDRALAPAPAKLIVLPTYSALLDLYRELARRGWRQPFWA
ncbi:MAG: MurT ligase domain-containing protein, partial [Syntrophothermus sp.]